ncbi:hypothetical protein BC938DRAFT_481192 [Jimgerdemannia flammicorona]|uniref:Zn(2)-C6 fungal-type domain-containing protein n=1 Tax=Jimgerdemannia flammicorona TaxID=994334 RepID=A0A433QHD8_9FUNG|nr:hypothetical protein BC938DRAFT_481192 [Jimgerdemannia flammicorona]
MLTLKWHTASMQDFPFKRTKASRACKECRRKKMRCDAARPVCNRCKKGELNCVYESSFSADKVAAPHVKKHGLDCRSDDICLASSSYIQALENRIRELETQAAPASPAGDMDQEHFASPDSGMLSIPDGVSESGFGLFSSDGSKAKISGLYEHLLEYQVKHARKVSEIRFGWNSLGVYGTLASRSSPRWEPLTRLLRGGHMVIDHHKMRVNMSPEMGNTLVDLFFANVYRTYPVVSRRFVAMLKEVRDNPNAPFSENQPSVDRTIYLNSLYYLTLRIASEDLLVTDRTAADYIFKCCSALFHGNDTAEKTLTRPVTSFLQGSVSAPEFTLAIAHSCFASAFYQGSIGITEHAFAVLGQAIRYAQVVGLHKKKNMVVDLDEEEDTDMNPQDRKWRRMEKIRENERLKRLWWSMFITDVYIRLYQGQPMMIDDDECDVDLPRIPRFVGGIEATSDETSRPDKLGGVGTTRTNSDYTEENESDCEHIRYFVHFLKGVRVQKKVLKSLYSKKAIHLSSSKISDVVQHLEGYLKKFHSSIPPEMQYNPDPSEDALPETATSITLHISYQTMRIQIHQQFIAPPPFSITDEQSAYHNPSFISPSVTFPNLIPPRTIRANATSATPASARSLEVCTTAAQRITECLELLTRPQHNEAYQMNTAVLGCCLAGSIHARNLQVEKRKVLAQRNEQEEMGQKRGAKMEAFLEARQWLQRTGDAIKPLQDNPTCARLGEILQEVVDEETSVLDELQEVAIEGLTSASSSDITNGFSFEDVMESYDPDSSNSESMDMFLGQAELFSEVDCNGQETPSLVSSSSTSESASSLSSLPTSTHFTDIYPYFHPPTSAPQFIGATTDYVSFIPQDRRQSYNQFQSTQGFVQTPQNPRPSSYPAPSVVNNQFILQASQPPRAVSTFTNDLASMDATMRHGPSLQQTMQRTRIHPTHTATAASPSFAQFAHMPTRYPQYHHYYDYDHIATPPPPRFPQHLIDPSELPYNCAMEEEPPEYVVASQDDLFYGV